MFSRCGCPGSPCMCMRVLLPHFHDMGPLCHRKTHVHTCAWSCNRCCCCSGCWQHRGRCAAGVVLVVVGRPVGVAVTPLCCRLPCCGADVRRQVTELKWTLRWLMEFVACFACMLFVARRRRPQSPARYERLHLVWLHRPCLWACWAKRRRRSRAGCRRRHVARWPRRGRVWQKGSVTRKLRNKCSSHAPKLRP